LVAHFLAKHAKRLLGLGATSFYWPITPHPEAKPPLTSQLSGKAKISYHS